MVMTNEQLFEDANHLLDLAALLASSVHVDVAEHTAQWLKKLINDPVVKEEGVKLWQEFQNTFRKQPQALPAKKDGGI